MMGGWLRRNFNNNLVQVTNTFLYHVGQINIEFFGETFEGNLESSEKLANIHHGIYDGGGFTPRR